MQPHKTSRLSGIETSWAIVFDAHKGDDALVITARQRLLMRYYRSVRRYLCALMHDTEVADELTHEFVIRFMRGDFKQANPSRGRFRDLLKRAIRNLAIDYWRRLQADRMKATPLPASLEPAMLDDADADQLFLRGWRKEITLQAVAALARSDVRTGRCYHAILQFKASHPKTHSAELAALFGASVDKEFTAIAFRQLLRRARARLADFLVSEVARSLRTVEPDEIEQELVELSLLSFCKKSLLRLRSSNFLRRRQRPRKRDTRIE